MSTIWMADVARWARRTVGVAAVVAAGVAAAAEPDAEGFVSIFDGKSLAGWEVSTKTGHSRTSGNTSGGLWKVEDGAITGSQDVPGNGGILVTVEEYGDFEVVLEMRNDFGLDSGLFLRSTLDGTAYQALVDYRPGGSLMGVYGEGRLGGRPFVLNFVFPDRPDVIREVPNRGPTALPVRPDAWPHFWRHGEWNQLRARITGEVPTITTWINGVKFMEWTEVEKRHPETGRIALQVHGGGDLTQVFVRYRNIRVKRL